MKKMILKSALLAVMSVGLMAGGALALTLDVGTKLLAIDGNLDTNTTVTLGILEGSPYTMAYSIDDTWVDLSDAMASFNVAGGTVFDLALYDGSTYFSLSGDADDDTYSISMDFSGVVDANIAANPTMSQDYWSNVTTTWTFSDQVGNGISTTMAFSPGDGVAPVPEPATMLLFGTGLVGLAGFSRKKCQKA